MKNAVSLSFAFSITADINMTNHARLLNLYNVLFGDLAK
jgi:hypothetical protein